MDNINIKGYIINIIKPNNYNNDEYYKLLILNDGDILNKLNLVLNDTIIVGVIPHNRLSEYTPWYHKAIKEGAPDFKGEGDLYNTFIANEVVNYFINNYKINKNYIMYGGYSLGGLIAIKSLYNIDIFTHIIPICSSFWYPDFINYIKSTKIINTKAKLYLLNGEKEGINHNNILKTAYECARIAHEVLLNTNDGISIFDEYAHHDHVKERFHRVLEIINK
ncbi:MAG: alpha/beta hydrolase [Anaeroplasmataceae bacterium]